MEDNKRIDEHDMTKKMLDTLRVGKPLIREFTEQSEAQVEEPEEEQEEEAEEEDTFELTGVDLKDAEEEFRDKFKSRVEFNPFYIKPQTNNAEWSGTFQDNEVEWSFNLNEENGLYLSMNQTQLTEGVVELVRVLRAQYEIWKDTWNENLSKESYKNDMG